MTLRNLIEVLKDKLETEPFVNQVTFGDVYNVNNDIDIEYPLVNLDVVSSVITKEMNTSYVMNLYYIDRLTENESNYIDICSAVNYTINSLVNKFAYENDIDINIQSNIQYFQQNFRDKCSGGYITINIVDYTPYDYCN